MDALHQRPRQWEGGTTLRPKAPQPRTLHKATPKGHRTDRIEGSYRSITVHQLSLAWWLHAAGHLTRRQLRVYFALHEMAERRRYAEKGCEPLYTLGEVMSLVGGRGGGGGGANAQAKLSGDLRALSRLGLARMSQHSIQLARSADQIALDDLSGFWTMLEHIPSPGRSVPVPRRMVRALAAGFTRTTTALVIAILIRGLFWHKQSNDYRTDGRYKLAWVAHVFGVSRRQLTDARATLIDLGWITPLEVNQWQKNRWGLHDAIVPSWAPPRPGKSAEPDNQSMPESASPRADFDPESASPDLTDSLSLTGDQETRRPAQPAKPDRAGPSGVSLEAQRKKGGRKRKTPRRSESGGGEPNIRDVQAADLASTDRLLELHRQAVEIGLTNASEAARLDFLSLAERARTRGKRAGALFYWLLREHKTAFITLHDEDQAARRLREHLNGPHTSRQQWGGWPNGTSGNGGAGDSSGGAQRSQPAEFTDDERIVIACIRAANKTGIKDPFRVAQKVKNWTRDRWDTAYDEHISLQCERQRGADQAEHDEEIRL